MIFSEAENVVDSTIPIYYYIFTLLPIIFLITSSPQSMVIATTIVSNSHVVVDGSSANPQHHHQHQQQQTNHQYLVYRVHQIDMPYGHFGTRASIFNLEPFVIDGGSGSSSVSNGKKFDSYIRKCAIFKWDDILKNYDLFIRNILQESLVSAVLIMIDHDFITSKKNFTQNEIIIWQNIEKKLLTNETLIPIYLIEENDEINQLYDDLSNSEESITSGKGKAKELKKRSKLSFFKDFFNKNIFFDSHQLVVNGPQVTSINDPIITSFQTKLIGAGIEDQIPTYAIVSHYDSYSIIPSLSFGADSNASGMIIFLELLRLFSKLYSNPKTRPRANLVFLLSGGGKINYFGTKKWLDENFDGSKSGSGSASSSDPTLDNLQFALCLESLADSMNENGLFMYVSKPPKTGTAAANFWLNLQDISKNYYPMLNTTMIHKKINLAEDYLFWEHEQFSLKRISAFTLTSLSTSKIIKRRTLIDFPKSDTYLKHLETYINIISESLVRQLFGSASIQENLFSSSSSSSSSSEIAISRPFINSLIKQITKIPRAQNLLLTTGMINQNNHQKSSNSFNNNNNNQYQLPSLLKMIQQIMKKYSDNNVKTYHFKIDPKNPEFIFYEPVQSKLFIYKTKPAIFDLFITFLILIYLIIFFLVVKYYNHLIVFTKFLNSEKEVIIKLKTK